MENLLEPVQIESMIYEIRGQKVMLEIDTIYQAIAALSVKEPSKQEPQRQKIGFKTSKDK